jgi:hypothetical protein
VPTNGYRTKTKAELSDYQKRIELIDNVILCVAEAERMINEIGRILAPDSLLQSVRPDESPRGRRRRIWAFKRSELAHVRQDNEPA